MGRHIRMRSEDTAPTPWPVCYVQLPRFLCELDKLIREGRCRDEEDNTHSTVASRTTSTQAGGTAESERTHPSPPRLQLLAPATPALHPPGF